MAKALSGNEESPLYHKFGDEFSKPVSWRIYWQWFKAAKLYVVFFLLFKFAGALATVNVSDLWLTSWTGGACEENEYTARYYGNSTVDCDQTLINWYYFKHYLVRVLSALLAAIAWVMGWRIAFKMAADRIHRKMIRSVLRAPMTTIMEKSHGEISNRFSRDINGIDSVVIYLPYVFLDGFFSIASYLVIIVMLDNSIIIGIIPCAIGVVWLITLYLRCNRQFLRLEAEAKSPYFTHFITSFNGLPTARALKLESKMVTDFHKFQNVFISVVSVSMDLLVWLEMMVGLVGVLFMAVVCAACMLTAALSSTASSSIVGLVLMYTLTILEIVQKNVRECVQVDNKMIHTKRCFEFTHLPREEPSKGKPDRPKKDDKAFANVLSFPIRDGEIKARSVSLRYSADSPWVLKDFDINIQPTEKV